MPPKTIKFKKPRNIQVKCMEGKEFLNTLDDNSVDLILTDPPYIISKESGMNKHYNSVKKNEEENIKYVKTEEEWSIYKKTLDRPQEELDADKGKGWSKENYLKYGTILGKKYCSKTEFGEWDKNFTMEQLNEIIKLYYEKLRPGGTLIIWFDLWKIESLKTLMTNVKKNRNGKWKGFEKIRFIEWIKTNPQPINSKISYLSNCREIALVGVKGSKATFNSSYDNGVYTFPKAAGKNKIHPTQKSLPLFEALIEKHSKEGDLVVDTFLGGGTTALACIKTKRKFKGCDVDEKYVSTVKTILQTNS